MRVADGEEFNIAPAGGAAGVGDQRRHLGLAAGFRTPREPLYRRRSVLKLTGRRQRGAWYECGIGVEQGRPPLAGEQTQSRPAVSLYVHQFDGGRYGVVHLALSGLSLLLFEVIQRLKRR
jgi:hypothetical protein